MINKTIELTRTNDFFKPDMRDKFRGGLISSVCRKYYPDSTCFECPRAMWGLDCNDGDNNPRQAQLVFSLYTMTEEKKRRCENKKGFGEFAEYSTNKAGRRV